MKEKAIKNYKEGYSCSESVVKSAIDKGLIPEYLLNIATPFSGGMSSGCLCGAVAGSQIVLGALEAKTNKRALAKQFVDKFKEKNKFTCCKALTQGLEFGSVERKNNCTKLVADCSEILNDIICNEM